MRCRRFVRCLPPATRQRRLRLLRTAERARDAGWLFMRPAADKRGERAGYLPARRWRNKRLRDMSAYHVECRDARDLPTFDANMRESDASAIC